MYKYIFTRGKKSTKVNLEDIKEVSYPVIVADYWNWKPKYKRIKVTFHDNRVKWFDRQETVWE